MLKVDYRSATTPYATQKKNAFMTRHILDEKSDIKIFESFF